MAPGSAFSDVSEAGLWEQLLGSGVQGVCPRSLRVLLRAWRYLPTCRPWGGGADGESQQEGKEGGASHIGKRLVLVIDPQITQGREDCLPPGEGLEGALWEADS